MNDRLLTPEEISILFEERQKADPFYAEDWSVYIAKAQDAKTSKWWIDEAEKPCKHYGNETNRWVKRCCDECWQALKKQIGGE